MATLQEIQDKLASITDPTEAKEASFDLLLDEVLTLVEAGDLVGAIALIDEIKNSKKAFIDAVEANLPV